MPGQVAFYLDGHVDEFRVILTQPVQKPDSGGEYDSERESAYVYRVNTVYLPSAGHQTGRRLYFC
jgi:hypothetical protein